ncbi:amidohydrolase [Aspergillus karnatakaensis]|uniref:amidohydrolase n=1 Tax=Aspergillus karnatakaensis TaxID=1810916 RepID=UPI003CCDC9F0
MTQIAAIEGRPAVVNIDKPWLLPPPIKYRLINANIIDPVEGQLIENASVLLSSGRITSITTSHNIPSNDETIVGLQGLYLCPGLIDAHVHVTATPGEQGLKNTYKAIPASMNHYRTTYVVREMLARGFTTVRDCGGADAALKQAINEWLIIGPRLNIAGHALSQTGGHGDQRDAHVDSDIQCCAGHKSGISRLCDGVPDCIVATRDEMRKGADFIKIMAGGGVASRLNNLSHSQFLDEELSAIVRTAESFDTYVTAHAYSNRAMRHAVQNGVRGIEHGNFLDEETAAFLASKDVFFTPTLATYHTLMKKPFDTWITPDLMAKNIRVMEAGLRALQIAESAGLTVCFGSDLMASMQPFQNNEFSIREKVQSNLALLQSATVNPARMMKMEGDVGRIAEGLWADILVLKENPLKDIRVLDDPVNILAVVKEGRVTSSRLSQFPVDIHVT